MPRRQRTKMLESDEKLEKPQDIEYQIQVTNNTMARDKITGTEEDTSNEQTNKTQKQARAERKNKKNPTNSNAVNTTKRGAMT